MEALPVARPPPPTAAVEPAHSPPTSQRAELQAPTVSLTPFLSNTEPLIYLYRDLNLQSWMDSNLT